MSSYKKEIRKKFRDSCLKRDNYKCVICGLKVSSDKEADRLLDVHHITNRCEMPSGGYVLENGITLCKNACHIKAEIFHSTGISYPGFSVNELYGAIKSSLNEAIIASSKL